MNILIPKLKEGTRLVNYENIELDDINLYFNVRHDGISFKHYADRDGQRASYGVDFNNRVENSLFGKICVYVGNGLAKIYRTMDDITSGYKTEYRLDEYKENEEKIKSKYPRYKYKGYYSDVWSYLKDDYVDGVVFVPRKSFKYTVGTLLFAPTVISVLTTWAWCGMFNTMLHIANGDVISILKKRRAYKNEHGKRFFY